MSSADSAAPRSDRRYRGGGRGRGGNRGGGGEGRSYAPSGGGEGRSYAPSGGGGEGRSYAPSGGSETPSISRQAWVPRGGPVSPAEAPEHNPQQMHQGPLDRGILGLPPPRGRSRSRRPSRPNPSGPPRDHPAPPRVPVRPPPPPPPSSDEDGSVPQLVQEIQDKLSKGAVECMICYDMVRRSAPIWSCSSCYSIFHLPCIKKWARSPTSTDTPSIAAAAAAAAAAAPEGRLANWRCPGCQSVQLTAAKDIQYTCFCGARRDPPNDLYLTPHSCGEPCGKPLDRGSRLPAENDGDRCPHLCVLQCHPGPCPPCKAFAEQRRCPCGKQSIVRRCSDRKNPLSCGEPCDRLLSCGRHRCERVCHTGPCGDCQVLFTASCFCKKKTEMVLCGEMEVKGTFNELEGIFACGSVCGKNLSCTNHTCEEVCHPGPCGECILSPNRVTTCHCGKTPLQSERTSCLDPVPTCSAVCDKLLPCRIHRCNENCHVGSCPPCLVSVNQKCRCGFTSRQVPCFKTLEHGKFLCEKPCGRKKNCGRHRCSEKCCPMSSNNVGQFTGDWDPHLCQMPCGKKLRCGQHSCQNLCHSGHCPPCLETIFTDLTCACRKTSIPPPLPCGTPYPSCPHPCMVRQPCGHAATHTCHFGDCPPCSVPVAKECIGGHVVLRNIPCGSKDIRCNQLCGKTRQCGMHACARTCHPSPCDAGQNVGPSGVKASCGQTCGAPRRDCRHTCMALCHPSSPCPDLRCEFHVTITCSCGRITANVPCSAGGNASDPLHEAAITQKLPVPLLPAVEATGRRVPLGQRKLACDEECEKWERKKVLAEAFDVTPPSLDALHFGENSALSDMLSDNFRRDPKWVLAVEERFKFMVLGKTKGASTSSLRVHVFCAMTKDKRDVVRQMAERWKLTVHAAGWEPKRFLVVHTTPKSKAPARILGSKPGVPITAAHPPAFDSLVDVDPRLVISLLDLPREADISALVLRFGGECELVWLNDKNALAVFSDPARAATALRRLDRGSVYQGASTPPQSSGGSGSSGGNVWGMGSREAVSGIAKSNNPWKKAMVAQESASSWGELDAAVPMWKVDEAPIPASMNRWTILESNGLSTSSYTTDYTEAHSGSQVAYSSSSQQAGNMQESQKGEEVDDWEKAYE